MKPVLFARIADMKYYQGITEDDIPVNGGSYVDRTGMAHECYNFDPVAEDGNDKLKCAGFCQLSGGRGVNQLHIEKIAGCELMKKEEAVYGVTVVFVSKAIHSTSMRVVGFYKNATVYRYPHILEFENGYEQQFNFEADVEDCVLLPYTVRHCGNTWFVPNSSSRYSEFGFGRSHIWYAGNKGADSKEIAYVERILNAIETYKGENWIKHNCMEVE